MSLIIQLLVYSRNKFAGCQLSNCSATCIQWNLRRRGNVGPERLALVERLAFVGIVCYSIFSERKRGVVLNLAVLGGNFLRKFNVPEPGRWSLAGVSRLLLFGGSKCVKSMLKLIRTLHFGRCREVGHCWEGPLTEVPLYIHPMFVFHLFIVNRLLFYLLLSQFPFSSLLTYSLLLLLSFLLLFGEDLYTSYL